MPRCTLLRVLSAALLTAFASSLAAQDLLPPSPGAVIQAAATTDPDRVFTVQPGEALELAPVSSWAAPVAPPACSSGQNCGGGCTSDGGSSGLCGVLTNLVQPSDRAFCNWISPISNPLFFEDPRTLSEVRVIFANHWIPQSNPVFLGGQARYVAVQARVALTERLSFIANKDGYIWIDPDNPALGDSAGWADITAGLKYNLIRDPENQRILSLGTTFEIPVGANQVFQGQSGGEFNLFATGGLAITPKSHWLSTTGFRLPTDTANRNQMWYWSNHYDYNFWGRWYGVVELNWFHYMSSGSVLPVGFGGGDLFNLGSTDVAGGNLTTVGIGARRKLWQMSELGVGYETPVSQRQDVLSSRLYVDLILRY